MNSSIVPQRDPKKKNMKTRVEVQSDSITAPTTSQQVCFSTVSHQKPRSSSLLVEAKRKGRLLKMQNTLSIKSQDAFIDIFQNALNAKNLTAQPTGLIYDESMAEHCCLWDEMHPECPERLTRVLKRCQELNLIERCKIIQARPAKKNEIVLLHSNEAYSLLEGTTNLSDHTYLEKLSSKFDSIFIHPCTFKLSLLAAGATIDLIEAICKNEIQNGMAIIRPPGHHAMKSEFNGYCFFNNVAIAAQHALQNLGVQKVMIIDWDVHHGQGTQRFFYENPRVLYFSIHRFEHGKFWPNLKESDYDAIGVGDGEGFNFNVPLNRTQMSNGDYLAIFQQLLIPIAIEYQPDLFIVSAGYDAALGCPEGEMEITPAFYPHLINPILRLAGSRVAVVLEGGYCLESLSEGAALTLRTLLGDPCPMLTEKLEPPCIEIQDAVLNCIYAHRPYWKCLNTQKSYSMEELNNVNTFSNMHKVSQLFIPGPAKPECFPTRGTAPFIAPEINANNLERLQKLNKNTKLLFPSIRVCYAYDDMMLKHENIFDESHPEHPKRIKKIYEMHLEFKLIDRMCKVMSRSATADEICLAHTYAYFNSISHLKDEEDLRKQGAKYNSVYFHPKTFECALIAVGSVLQIVDEVLSESCRSGVCIVRPPGHHAEANEPQGFCIFNNAAIAAQYALQKYSLQRVLIVDWDIHHGNGTQHIFESNPNVLYISVHRYENGTFFPKGTAGNFDFVGKGAGVGLNVNIPWNKKGMGDMEYVLAFQQIIMPIAYEFNPQLVIVSAGFDAAIGDPLGGCKVTPEAYGHFTHWLSALANGHIIMLLEGGYNINSISYAMTMCSKVLLGDPIPPIQLNMTTLPLSTTFLSCIETIQQCLTVQAQYWHCLAFNKSLPQNLTINSSDENLINHNLQDLNISRNEKEIVTGSNLMDGTRRIQEPDSV